MELRTLLFLMVLGVNALGCSAFERDRRPVIERPPQVRRPLAITSPGRPGSQLGDGNPTLLRAPNLTAQNATPPADPSPMAAEPIVSPMTMLVSNPPQIPAPMPMPMPIPIPTSDPVPTTINAPPLAPMIDPLDRIVRAAIAKYASIESFECKLTRREVVKGRLSPEEVMRYRFRKAPFSVHLKWIGKESTGREMIYVQGRHDDKMQILTADGDMPLTRAGARLAFSPDSFMVRSRSRHSIREAGLEVGLERLRQAMELRQRGRVDAVRYLGNLQRADCPIPLEYVEAKIYPGEQPLLPKGGKRLYGFDSQAESNSQGLPVLIITHDETGREVEYFRLDRMIQPIPLDDRDFDPTLVWGKPK